MRLERWAGALGRIVHASAKYSADGRDLKEDPVPETLTDQQRHAHARVTRQGIATTAAALQELLGQRLVPVIAGVKDAKAVGRWARGDDIPRAQAAATLQNALHVVALLRSQEDDETIRSWFRGMNPDLGDRSPALVVRDKPEDVIQAARAFLAQ